MRINLIWVPGHRNTEGNCIADEVAGQGTTIDILRNKDTVGMPTATCKLLFKQRLFTLSNNRWNTISACHTSRLIWPNYNPRKNQNFPTMQHFLQYDISALINGLTRHCLLGTHARRLGLSNHVYCRSCKQVQETFPSPWKLYTSEPCGHTRRKQSQTVMFFKKDLIRETH